MTIETQVTTNADELPRALRNFRDQVPFATVGALNDTAFDARKAIQNKALRTALTLRNKHTERGIRVRKATKQSLEAEVGSIDWYLEDQVTGGRREANFGISINGTKYLAIPAAAVKRTSTGKIPKRLRPGTLLGTTNISYQDSSNRSSATPDDPKVFLMDLDDGRLVIARRRSKSDPSVQIMWFLVERTAYRKRVNFKPTVDKVAATKFPRHFRRRMVKAARTAK